MLNGSPKDYFLTTWGLRQGDPLSPFLFTLVADAFTQILRESEEHSYQRILSRGKHWLPYHSSNIRWYIAFSRWRKGPTLKLNLIDSLFWVSIRNENKLEKETPNLENRKDISNALECQIRNFPFEYLGVPLGGSPSTRDSWLSV